MTEVLKDRGYVLGLGFKLQVNVVNQRPTSLKLFHRGSTVDFSNGCFHVTVSDNPEPIGFLSRFLEDTSIGKSGIRNPVSDFLAIILIISGH